LRAIAKRGGAGENFTMSYRSSVLASAFGALLSILAAAALAPAFAQQTTPPAAAPLDPAAQQNLSLQGFGAKNPTCLEWNDGCATCRRDAGGAVHCSTTGIACQPTDIVCKAPTP
jgi:hypothetical protein